MKSIKTLAVLLIIASASAFAFAQNPTPTPPETPNVVGEVIVTADDPIYKNLRLLSSDSSAFSGEYASVNNLVLKKDEGIFTLQNGEIYFIKSVEGKTTGAVFIGNGEFSLTPPTEAEKKHISIFTDKTEVKDNFKMLTMFFTDDTFEEIKKSANAQMKTNGPQAEKARNAFRNKENLLKNAFRYNISSRILADIYAPNRKGFFTAFIDGDKFNKLIYQLDPIGLERVYPEQVSLTSYDSETGGIWAAFHLAEEYKNGTGNSWRDRRIYDIIHHNIETKVDGTNLIAKDEITLKMVETNARFLPFDLFGNLRVKSVLDENGGSISFIQEKSDKDSDFGIILPESKKPGESFKITVEYEGTKALAQAGSGNYILLPRSTWYPNNPMTSFGDRATFDITFRYPKNYVMVGIGSRVGEETTENNQKVSKWTTGDTEMTVAGFNYGDFKMQEIKDAESGYNLEVFVNRDLPNEMKAIKRQIEDLERRGVKTDTTLGALNTTGMTGTVLNEAQNSMRIYNTFFGKLPYERIAMTQQPAGFFGQAWATLVFMPYIAFIDSTLRSQILQNGTDGFWREVAAHEVAHQWWGHIVGWTSYRDQWMSEGFAQFSTSLYIQYVRGDLGKFIEFWEDLQQQIVKATPATKNRKPFTIGPVTQGYRLNSGKTGGRAYSNLVYPKGAFILHMLRLMMFDNTKGTGDARFIEMMKDFTASHYNKDVSTEDFKLIVEKHMLPSMNLTRNGKMDWFFDEWVYGTEMPSYDLEYKVNEKDGRSILSGKITQSGVSDKFTMIVPIYADFGKGWVFLGSARMIGNNSIDLGAIPLPTKPKKVAVAALQDVLAEKITSKKL